MLIRSLIYGLLGWCLEIVWTALPLRLPRDGPLKVYRFVVLRPCCGLVGPLLGPVPAPLLSRPRRLPLPS